MLIDGFDDAHASIVGVRCGVGASHTTCTISLVPTASRRPAIQSILAPRGRELMHGQACFDGFFLCLQTFIFVKPRFVSTKTKMKRPCTRVCVHGRERALSHRTHVCPPAMPPSRSWAMPTHPCSTFLYHCRFSLKRFGWKYLAFFAGRFQCVKRTNTLKRKRERNKCDDG